MPQHEKSTMDTASLTQDQKAVRPLHDQVKTVVPQEIKEDFKAFYNTVSEQLDSSVFGPFSYFLNYGYVGNGSPEMAVVDLPDHYLNRNSVKLVLETVGDCRIDGMRILDVGCGRGGTLRVLKTFFVPASLTGIDLSTNAIEFCKKAHEGISFFEGDAENLPFPGETFDVITNVESSHSYPSLERFYSEVYRVLCPGGYFLYTDLLPAAREPVSPVLLRDLGFQLEAERDITENVLLSSDEVASTRVGAFASGNDNQLLGNFLAVPQSDVYEAMRSRLVTYKIWKIRKP